MLLPLLRRVKKLLQKKLLRNKPTKVKYLVVGLGNIGPEYAGTRHNIGFDVLDLLARDQDVSFTSARLGDVADFRHRGRSYHLLKPSTYMNRSGRAVAYWLEKLKLQPDRLLVVVDDLNLPLGKLRMRAKGSDGGHNGLADIQRYLGAKYPRMRIGIGDTFGKGTQVNFVLGPWEDNELPLVRQRCEIAAKGILDFGTLGLSRAMERVNAA